MGVYECIDLVIAVGAMDPSKEPRLISEGPAFAVFDGNGSSGYYTVSLMAEKAIELARDSGIAIVYGGNHFDAGSFAYYVHKAYQQDMVGIASNNSVPLAAPMGGMENLLSCCPFDAIIPGGDETPIWASLKFAEFYDADIAEAVLQDKPMKGKWLIDPQTGELTDDAKPYARPIPGYGRVWDYTCGGQIETPRTYALNMWNEGMTAIINPLGVPSTEMPTIEDVASGDMRPSVGGSYFMCINPARFGSIDAVKQKSDAYINKIKTSKTRPGQSIRIPGENGYQSLKNDQDNVEVLTNHWQPFFETIAGRHGLTEESLRQDFASQSA
ncbi:MAG: Ldh family oxidoreductase [Pseudomonadales bacterium]